MDYKDAALKVHENHGKISVVPKVQIRSKEDLNLIYTPGVAEVCKELVRDREKTYKYTMKGNSVAIITDGSAVLGLKNIGPWAALPVMEGKSVLFKELSNIDAFPLCLRTQDPDEIISIVRNIAPAFGGVNLEDIAAPNCFDIEKGLQDIGIPVMHDDQHGTAIVILAGLINAAKVVGKPLEDLKVVVNGAGAAGFAVTKLLLCLGVDKKICTSVKEIIVCDSRGAIHEGRADLNTYKRELAQFTNALRKKGTLGEVIEGADVFIGVSTGNVLTKEMIMKMGRDPIVFAMANPTPEIAPEQAKGAAAIFGTGRSDFPNQINNSLAFPGVFRGALDARARIINNEMKIAAANAIATYIKNPTKDNVLPSTLDKGVAKAVAEAVRKAALDSGVA
jgi:malate dehydrogenase (oxaloacetate-decarboxylating)